MQRHPVEAAEDQSGADDERAGVNLTTGPVHLCRARSRSISSIWRQREIWDALYRPQCSGNSWRSQKINLGGVTNGPAAVTAPFVDVYLEADQQHFAYLASNGEIWDAFWCQKCGSGQWKLQKINLRGSPNGPAATSRPSISEYLIGNRRTAFTISSTLPTPPRAEMSGTPIIVRRAAETDGSCRRLPRAE